jgi:hypothetical protein
MKVDYSQAKIYKITNDYNNDIYVGSTCDTLVKRFSYHKADAIHKQKLHKPLYKLINEIGFERFRIELIENVLCNDLYELRQKEGKYIREFGTLNVQMAGRTIKEYKEEFKEEIKIKDKIYYEKNKEVINKKHLEYYYANRETELIKKKELIKCDCGCEISRINMARHKKSKKHIDLMNNINI